MEAMRVGTYEETGGTVESLSGVIRLAIHIAFFLG